jgi:hypothetical protein
MNRTYPFTGTSASVIRTAATGILLLFFNSVAAGEATPEADIQWETQLFNSGWNYL